MRIDFTRKILFLLFCILPIIQADVKITVEEKGPYVIKYETIKKFFPSCYAKQIHFFLKNKLIPIKIWQKSKGLLQKGDKIYFYSHGKKTYRLSYNSNIAPSRWKEIKQPSGTGLTKKKYFRKRRWEKNKIIAPFAMENVPISPVKIDHQMWTQANKKGHMQITFDINDCAYKTGLLSVSLLHSYTRKTKGMVNIFINDNFIGTHSVLSLHNLPVKTLNVGKNTLRLQLNPGSYLPLYLNTITLQYTAKCMSIGEVKSTKKNVGYALPLLDKNKYFFLDKNYNYTTAYKQFIIPYSGVFFYWQEHKCKRVISISEYQINFNSKKQLNHNYIAIVPKNLTNEIQPLITHRKEQGHSVFIISPQEIYDTYDYGIVSTKAINSFIEHAYNNNDKKCEYLLLVGDVPSKTAKGIPTHYVYTYFDGRTATDYPYVENYKSLTIGRLPSNNKKEMRDIIQKIIAYEKSGGAWQNKLHFFAGQGGFGNAIDSFSEFIFKQLMYSYMPKHYDVTMTYANPTSPYFYPPNEFPQKILQRFSEGSLFLIYIGHGDQNCFAPIKWKKKKYPMFEKKHALKIGATKSFPVVVSIACSTSRFDSLKKSLGETMLLKKGGPVAFIGSSRISHPYANALFGKAMMKGIFHKKYKTLGKLLRHTQEELINPPGFDFLQFTINKAAKLFVGDGSSPEQDIDRIRKEHVYLYNLLGDPATKIKYPKNNLSIKIQAKTATALMLKIKGNIAPNSKLYLSIEKDLLAFTGTKNKNIKKNYEAANNKIIYEISEIYNNQTWKIPINNIPHGEYYIKARVVNDKGCLLGVISWEYLEKK